MFAEIDAASAAFAEEHKLPGLVAGIVDQGSLVHVTALGLADREAGRKVGRDTAFRIASMTKNMTALAIAGHRGLLLQETALVFLSR
jgi:CubicO group peptidase (beta-lactamase class C family)